MALRASRECTCDTVAEESEEESGAVQMPVSFGETRSERGIQSFIAELNKNQDTVFQANRLNSQGGGTLQDTSSLPVCMTTGTA